MQGTLGALRCGLMYVHDVLPMRAEKHTHVLNALPRGAGALQATCSTCARGPVRELRRTHAPPVRPGFRAAPFGVTR